LPGIEEEITGLVNEVERIYKDNKKDKDILYILGNAIANSERDHINSTIIGCTECGEIGQYGKSIISGDLREACILIVSDYPTQQQLDSGEESFAPFEFTDGFENLKEYIGQQVSLDKIAWINSVCCCPFQEINGKVISRPPTSTEAKNCKHFLQRLFDIMRITKHVLCIITMGNIALNALIPNSRIEKVRGEQLSYSDTPVFPMYNPLCIAGDSERDVNKREDFQNDIDNALNWIVENCPDVKKEDN